jgi:hypothetical protein
VGRIGSLLDKFSSRHAEKEEAAFLCVCVEVFSKFGAISAPLRSLVAVAMAASDDDGADMYTGERARAHKYHRSVIMLMSYLTSFFSLSFSLSLASFFLSLLLLLLLESEKKNLLNCYSFVTTSRMAC